MSTLKPIKIWGDKTTPNPPKVLIILEELNLPYEYIEVGFAELKQKPYTDLNPNGRMPTIEDPNTGLVLWETGAILQYLIGTYDKDGKISYSSGNEQWQQLQWLSYQISGQGPYFGQYTWFSYFYPEKIPGVIDRYLKEAERVNGVLDSHLQKHEWLVGDKCTFADLAFLTWANTIKGAAGDKMTVDYPAYDAWVAKMNERPAVKKIVDEQKEALAKRNAQ
jgi:glutathione S-transferase